MFIWGHAQEGTATLGKEDIRDSGVPEEGLKRMKGIFAIFYIIRIPSNNFSCEFSKMCKAFRYEKTGGFPQQKFILGLN